MNADLSELMTLDRAALVGRWQQMFGHPAPALIREELLRQALGWQLQAAAQGKLSGMERKRLRDGSSGGASNLAAGSHLIRVWQGENTGGV
jgi:hypothetical protein